MNIIPQRILSKINNDVFQNSRRLFAFKYEMTPAGSISPVTTEDVSQANNEASIKSENFRPISQLQNSQMRDVGVAAKQNLKVSIENQQLQPSMLPQYYQKYVEKNVLLNPEMTEEIRINQKHSLATQRFQVSKTHANALLPLKSIKLASPFPDPVKIMMSRTISDDEKAAQMLEDSKCQRNHVQRSATSNLSNFRSFSTDATRWFSSKTVHANPEKCKKTALKKQKEACPKISLKDCPPARTNCEPIPKKIDCKKQEAPYPAYSEFCHEEQEENPSECKMCPWRPEENPNFKPQKRHFHAAQHPDMLKRTGLELTLDDINFEKLAKLKEMQMNLSLEESATEQEMLCDLRKPPCERPKTNKCPPPQEKSKEPIKKDKQPQKDRKNLDNFVKDKPIVEVKNQLLFDTCEKPQNQKKPTICNVRKFKFPPCSEKSKRKEQIIQDTRCPSPKKKRLIIDDCPGNKEEKESFGIKLFEETIEFNLSGKKKDNNTSNSSKINNEKEKMEERCKKKRKENSRTCPGDLIKKKQYCPETKRSKSDENSV